MTKAEFIEKQQARVRHQGRHQKLVMGAVGLVFFGGLPLVKYVDRHPEAAWLGATFLIVLLVSLVLAVAIMLRQEKQSQRKFGLLCPHCGHPLIGLSSQIVVATGNCGHCGEKVITS